VEESVNGTAGVGIEPLSRGHDRRSFSCGVEALDVYLKRFARQHAETNISRTYVALSDSTVVGFYSLAMSGIRRENLPEKYASRFPNFPLPVARLARLGVDLRHQRQGLGELLLADALQRCLRLSESIGMLGMIVDAKDSQARAWYERYEFERLPDAPLTLWLPTTALAKM
jgi:GNAT superfamily N-acetyltransferase